MFIYICPCKFYHIMTKVLLKTIATLLIVIGGLAVVTDFFGTGTGNQYLFNFFYFILVLPASVGALVISKEEQRLILKGDERR